MHTGIQFRQSIHHRSLYRAILLVPLLFSGCATTGATLGSGVGDALLEHPPFYAGDLPTPSSAERDRLGHLPIAYQRGAIQSPIFDPTLSPAMQALLAEMNAYLDSIGVSARLVDGGRVSAVAHADTRVPPDVRFSCVTSAANPFEECAAPDDGIFGRDDQWMELAVGRPSGEWTEWMRQVMLDSGVDRTLVITLEVGQYLVRQRDFQGNKVVELGTSHVEELPWLTSLETPVMVLQLTGAVVGPDGRAVRIGAEGLIARRTSLVLSAVGAQELITDEDVELLRVARREDLRGEPLVWQVGLRNLVEQLTGARVAAHY